MKSSTEDIILLSTMLGTYATMLALGHWCAGVVVAGLATILAARVTDVIGVEDEEDNT
jgi:hypothetical protein